MSMLLAAALTAAMASPVEPQAQTRVAPRGSYAQSCTGAYVNQGRLYADCRDERGQMRGTSIELARCSSDEIVNTNGLLVCGRFRGEYEASQGGGNGNGGGWGGGNTRPPSGSYTRSCDDAVVDRGRLYAQCQVNRNQRTWSSIEVARCSGTDIANIEGVLTCGRNRGRVESGRPGGNGGGWGGGNGGGWGRTSITVYADANYRGRSATFDRETRSLNRTGVERSISSLRLQGSWEVCTEADFRGTCRTITSDTADLRWSPLNDRIASLRPARR